MLDILETGYEDYEDMDWDELEDPEDEYEPVLPSADLCEVCLENEATRRDGLCDECRRIIKQSI